MIKPNIIIKHQIKPHSHHPFSILINMAKLLILYRVLFILHYTINYHRCLCVIASMSLISSIIDFVIFVIIIIIVTIVLIIIIIIKITNIIDIISIINITTTTTKLLLLFFKYILLIIISCYLSI